MAGAVVTFVFLLYFLSTVSCDKRIPKRKCATLYSQRNFEGDQFIVNDFDQAVNTRRDFRASINGWQKTGSVDVEEECQLKICDDIYFTGNCTLVQYKYNLKNTQVSEIRSVACTCERHCTCAQFPLPLQVTGHAYLKGGCKTCDTEYIPIKSLNGEMVRTDPRYVAEAFKIQPGCNITLYSGRSAPPRLFTREIVEIQDFPPDLSAYVISCNYNEDVPIKQSSENEDNTGFRDSIMESQSEMHLKNVHILFIGLFRPSQIFGINGCDGYYDKPFIECRIPVKLEQFNATTELRVIHYNDESHQYLDIVDGNYQIMATLDEYLSNHEELNTTKPNAIILSQRIIDADLDSENSQFQRKLQVLDTLRHKILNEDYSNVIYLLTNNENDYNSPMDSRYPEEMVSVAEKAINQKWEFPKPLTMTTHRYSKRRTFINGFRKMDNQDYWPMNIRDNLIRICEKSGDPNGALVLKEAFNNENAISSDVTIINRFWLYNQDAKVTHFRACLTEASPPKGCPNNPENHVKSEKITNLSQMEDPLCPSIQEKYLELQEKIRLLEQKQIQYANQTASTTEAKVERDGRK